MIYLKSFDLPTRLREENFFFDFRRRACFNSGYPFGVFAGESGLEHIEFSDITIFSGGNGSGKSTLLNVIAEKLSLKRKSEFNKTYFFEPYCNFCKYEMSNLSKESRANYEKNSSIITSDDVFDHMISVRQDNADIFSRRREMFEEKDRILAYGGNYKEDRPRNIHIEDPKSFKEFADYADLTKLTGTQFARQHIGMEERTYSNGENGFKYFASAIKPGGLYLLDEPENSLSAIMQTELTHLLHGMVSHYGCQFIISSHSPFILSMQGAKIYDLDAEPVTTRKWTELSNVRLFYDFFKEHESEFD